MKRSALLVAAFFWALFDWSPAEGQEFRGTLDPSEQRAMADTLQYSLEYNRTDEASAWVNPDADRSGTTVPVRTYQGADGRYCREFVQTIIIGGQEQQGYGTACRQPDGSWAIVSDRAPAAPAIVKKRVEQHVVYRTPYPSGYYYYDPWGYFYPSHIFFSFAFLHGHDHFDGHRHFLKRHHGHFDGRRHFRDGGRGGAVHVHRGGKFEGERGSRGGGWSGSGRGGRGGHR